MESIIQNRSVDLQSNRYASVIIKQGDRDTRTVIFKLTDNGIPYSVPPGITVYLSGTRADGSAIIQKLEIDGNGNYPYTFTEYDVQIYGRSRLEIKLVEDTTDKVLSSMTFVLVVEKSALSDQQIADAGDSGNLFKELVVALENAKNLQGIVDGLKDDVAGVEAIGKEISDNEKIRQANESVRIQNEEERKRAEIQRNTKINESLSTLNTAVESADGLIEQVGQTDETAQQTIRNLDDALSRLNESDLASMSMPEVSDTMPDGQRMNGIWFVSEQSGASISWENTENGDYAFVKSGSVWTSNNKGVNSSTAASSWEITLPEDVEYPIKYKVSSETSYDKFTLTLDNTTIIANGISGAGSEITYAASLKAGTHTLAAKYVKDSSQNKNDDCAYVILEPILFGDGTGAVRKVAVKTANNGTVEDYQYHPIITDSIYVTRPDGKTVEESLAEIESGGAGVNITVDDLLSATSMNPVANKAVAEKVDALETVINENTSKISAIAGNSHAHGNKTLLDALSYSDGKLYYNGIVISENTTTSSSHSHTNKAILDLLSCDTHYNTLAYNNVYLVQGESSDFNDTSHAMISNYFGMVSLNATKSSNMLIDNKITVSSSGIILSSMIDGYGEIMLGNLAANSGVEIRSANTTVCISNSALYPDAQYRYTNLGTASDKWDVIYANSGTIQASDRNEKKNIQYISDDYAKSIIMGLKPCSYKFLENTSDRVHSGMIAQDVEELLESLRIDSKDFAAFIKYKKEETDDDGNPVCGYGLRYEEFISPLIKFVQYQQHKIENLEERIAMLEN